jgi:hypothetical protein
VRRPSPIRSKQLRRRAVASPARDLLTPILVDYNARDGSTLTMRLLATSPQIAVGDMYPYEQKYFAYLWRWSRLLTRADWDAEEWAPRNLGSIAQERGSALMGPPPWRHRELMIGVVPGEAPMSETSFESVWREFSRRATARTRVRHGRPDADVHYYAEKHSTSWRIDRHELPPLRMLVLLRDPRDIYASLTAFRETRNVDLGRSRARDEADDLRRFIDRQRQRLRWIAGLPEDAETAVARYEDLVRDLPGVARRLEDWLEVELDANSVTRDRLLGLMHGTARTTEESIGRWRVELAPGVAETISRELRPELEALGL